MGKISLSYPDTGLTISISVKNRDTGVEDFSGTMTEVGTTKEYKYDFMEVVDTDYVYIATVSGYSPMSGVVYRDGGGLTTEQSEQLTRIDTRVDIPVSDSIGSYGRQVIDYSRIDKKIEETFEDIKKDIQEIQPTDITEILSELESIKKKLATKPVETKKIDFKQETDKIMELLKKQDKREETKENKEKEKEDKKRIKQEKEQKEILDTLEEIESKISERKEIEEEIDKEEINNILKLLK